MPRHTSVAILFTLALTASAFGQETSSSEVAADQNAEKTEEARISEGHSAHGEAFNEGPRQAAYLMENIGKISFPVSTKSEMAQKFVNQGVAQLHGFWYFEAERSFRQAASLDPDCAMTYWGMAMANTSNKDRAKGFIKEATERKDKATEREKMYIAALDAWYKADEKKATDRAKKYIDALEKLSYKFPEDREARALIGLQMWINRRYTLPIQSHLAVNALLQDVLREQPDHPCHHYVIHLWDAEKPEKALVSASQCGQAAPGIAHMWHMPGHIYSKLKRYEDAIYQQEASARVDHAHMMRDRVLPDQISNFAHNNEWLIRNLIKLGHADEALALAKNMTELPRHPKYNHFKKNGSAAYGRKRLFDTLNGFEMWDELIALSETPYLEPTENETEQIKRLRHLGRAWFRKGNVEQGKTYLAKLEGRLTSKQAEQKKAGEDAEKKAREEAIKKAVEAAAAKQKDKEKKAAKEAETEPVEESEGSDGESEEPTEAKAAPPEPKLDKKAEKAIAKAKKDAERKFTGRVTAIKNAISELKGHIALANSDFDEALKLLKKASNFSSEFRAEIEVLAGKQDDAIKTARKNVKKKKNEVLALASLVEILVKAEKKDEARKEFERLRTIAGSMNTRIPAYARLTKIAHDFGHDKEWRIVRKPSKDVGNRPTLDSLGPVHWEPSPAGSWTLTDATGKQRSLSDYKGKPVVVIFYLGAGCLHCVEQLQKFAPKTSEFEEAGLSLIAISSDPQDRLTDSVKNYEHGRFPFPLVSDSGLDVFKAYRAYDDFEKMPLHGTFIIDGQGRIHWQDISYEPFNDPDFVIKEAMRLLGRNRARMETAKTAEPASSDDSE